MAAIKEHTISFLSQQLENVDVLSPQEESQLIQQAQNGDIEARNKLVKHNLKFVILIASRYTNNPNITINELINAGTLGLMHAITKYDPNRNIKFISYAVWWIRVAMQHALVDATNTIRVPLNLNYKSTIYTESARNSAQLAANCCSLDEIFNTSSPVWEARKEMARSSYLKDDRIDVQQQVETNMLKTTLYNEMKALLTDKERDVIEMWYGFKTGSSIPLKIIAKKYSLSAEGIRLIIQHAKQKLKKSEVLQNYLN